MSFRKLLFWIHLSMGIVAGSVILIMCVTGIVLAFQRQIVAAVDRRSVGSFVSPVEPQHISVEAIATEIGRTTGIRPTALTISRDPSTAVEVDLGEQRTIYVSPYSGAVLGEGSQRLRSFFHTTVGLHRWLGASGTGRDAGKSITGASNLLFPLLLCSGLFLWMPRRWSWLAVRRSALFRGNRGGRARFWNWHNVFGIWCAVPLLLITVSGVVISYRWANDVVYRITGNQPPALQARNAPRGEKPQGTAKQGAEDASAVKPPASLDLLLQNTQQQVQNWQSITLQTAPTSAAPSAIVLTGPEGRPDKRVQLTFDSATGAVTRSQSFATYNSGRRLRAWLRFIHTGEAAGVAGQAIAAVASFGGAALTLTGFILAILRLVRFRARSRTYATEQMAEAKVA